MNVEDLKKMPVTHLAALVKAGYKYRRYADSTHYHSWIENDIKRFAKRNAPYYKVTEQELFEASKAFSDWIRYDQKEVEIWLAERSPVMLAKLAISTNTRLGSESEKIVLSNAKNKAGLVDYACKFGVILPDISSVTLKAAFGEKNYREKRYIKIFEESKRNLKDLVGQMLNSGQIKAENTVQELLDSIQ